MPKKTLNKTTFVSMQGLYITRERVEISWNIIYFKNWKVIPVLLPVT
jgi:hypothetical protein